MARPIENLTPKARKTRADILFAAREIIGESGVDGLNVLNVCEGARVGRTSFYNYFEDVSHLVSTIASETALGIKSKFDAFQAHEPRGLARLKACLEMVLHLGADDAETALLLTALARYDPAVRTILHSEISTEIASMGEQFSTKRELLTSYLTSTVLVTVRDIAKGRIERDHIKPIVSFMLAGFEPPGRDDTVIAAP